VTRLIEDPPATPYTALKHALLASHQLTDYQRVEQLHQVEAMGDRRPSELLAVMLEICPRGQDSSLFFQYLFIQRLPRELRILLGDDDHTDLRRLASRADKLWALHARQAHDPVAAVHVAAVEDNSSVAAVQRGSRPGGTNKRPAAKFKPPQRTGPSSGGHTDGVSPQALAMQSAGLCFYHWTFGDHANQCKSPCSWQGN